MSKQPSFSALMKPQHLKAVRAIGYAMTLGDADAWTDLTTIFLANLTEAERAGIAYAALNAMTEDNAYSVASLSVFGVYAGEVAA